MAFASPEQILREMNLAPGMVVVDIGAGSGAYSLGAARAVSPDGLVYAVDVQNDLLLRLKAAARAAHITNLDIIHANAEQGTKLKSGIADRVILSNVLFQAEDKEALLAEAKRILRQNGELALIDWSDSFGNLGPRKEAVVGKDASLALARSLSFTIQKEIPSGDHHYGLILTRS